MQPARWNPRIIGILGALVALPAAVCLYILILFFELVVPWNRRRLGETLDPASEVAPDELT